MTTVIGVRFKRTGKSYYFDPGKLEILRETGVIVETARGVEYGICAMPNTEIADERVVQPLRRVLREATPQDLEVVAANKEKEARALEICQRKAEQHKLEMKVVDAEYTFDASKILFYFTADGRVDFRVLVKDLASEFHTRIELRQIGVRDEAKMLGGLGICGKPFCCSTFLDEFHSVSIKMAKEQNLSLNPVKISGTCGRLMCCLTYEQAAYEDLQRTTPRVDSIVQTPAGSGTVVDVNLLRGKIKVRLDSQPDSPVKLFDKADLVFSTPCGGCPKRRKPRRPDADGNNNEARQRDSAGAVKAAAPPAQGAGRPDTPSPSTADGSHTQKDASNNDSRDANARRRSRNRRNSNDGPPKRDGNTPPE